MPIATTRSIDISAVQWQSLLGEQLPEQTLSWLNERLQISEIPPGQSCWHSAKDAPGLYIVLAGKVRLFDDRDEKLVALGVGDTFGVDRLFAPPYLANHGAKAALTKNSHGAIVGCVVAADITKLWQEFPKIETHLQQHRQLVSQHQGTSGKAIRQSLRFANEPIVLTPQQIVNNNWQQPTPAPAKVKVYFPSPTRQISHWWQKQLGNTNLNGIDDR